MKAAKPKKSNIPVAGSRGKYSLDLLVLWLGVLAVAAAEYPKETELTPKKFTVCIRAEWMV